MQAIVIATTPGREEWLANLLKSFGDYRDYKIMIISDHSYELGKIKFVMEHTDIDEFVLLHDSCEIKDTGVFALMFNNKYSVAFSRDFFMYMGKYQRWYLKLMDIPYVVTKRQSVEQERTFNEQYALITPYEILEPQLIDKYVFEEKFGRTNMVVENKWIKKYKGTWDPAMIKD